MNSYYFYFDRESKIQHLHLIDTKTSTLIGYFRIEEDIRHATFFSKNKFFVLTDNSGIYTGEIGSSELTKVVEEQGHQTPGYYLDKEKGEFWIATTIDDGDTYVLQCWNLFKGTLEKEIELPEYTSTSSLTRRRDGCFVFYNHDFNSLSSSDDEHGFYCTNTDTQETLYYKLDSKPAPAFGYLDRNALFANNKDIAVLPAADEYICTIDDKGESSYEYQVQLIDLKDFSVRWKKCVNKFTLKDICNHYEDKEDKKKKLDGLVTDSKSSTYNKVAEDWSEFLDSIMLCDDEDAFWLRWSNDSISKVDFNGNLLTPIYHLEHKKEGKSKISLIDRSAQVNNERLIMLDNTLVNIGPFYYIDLLQSPYKNDEKEMLSMKKIKRQKLKISDTYKAMLEKYDVVLIEVSNFNKKGTYEAVSKMAEKMEDIKSLVINDKLIFEFIDNYGRYKSEYDVIGSAIYEEKCIPFIKEYLNLFCKYSNSKNLLNAQEKPALSSTAIWLLEIAPESFDILSSYFNAIDPKKSEYFIEKILPAVKEYFSNSKEYEAFEKSLPKEFFKRKKTINWFK